MTPTIYISGTGRSGTNILKEILGSHSEVATLPFEHRFTIDPDGLVDYYRNVDNWSPYLAEARLKRLESFLLSLAQRDEANHRESQELKAGGKTGHPYAGWELEKWIPGYIDRVKELISSLTKFSYEASYPGSEGGIAKNIMYYPNKDKKLVRDTIAAFIDECHLAIVTCEGKKVFAEDNTWSILCAGSLCELTPQAKMIHIVRDPRDVVSSMQEQNWTPSNVDQVIDYYQDIMDKWMDEKSDIPQSFYKEIRLEDLVENTEKTIMNICQFVGIEFEEKMLDIELTSTSIGRYRSHYSEKEIGKIESHLSRAMSAYNYN